jgi:hypothetical protein
MRGMERLRRAAGTAATATLQAASLQQEIDGLRAQVGGLESRAVAALADDEIASAEFKVYSQFGEDGIVQFLVQRVPIENDVFVEFGVEDYRESNTRFLLLHDNWRGLVMDGSDAHERFLRASGLGWRHHIDAVTAFIDRDNIDGLIRSAGIQGDIGLLSVDIDGNDLWVLEEISVVSPRILIVEYNATFGPEAAVTVPYDPGFVRSEKHWSNLYWGASLAAFARVAGEKGYALVAGNRAGNNAFFVRKDVLGAIPELSVADAWRPSRFRESRTRDGSLSYVTDPDERLRLMRDLPVYDLERGAELSIAERYALA